MYNNNSSHVKIVWLFLSGRKRLKEIYPEKVLIKTVSNGASNACVPTNTKKHPNRYCGSGVVFCLLRLLPQPPANEKSFWATLL